MGVLEIITKRGFRDEKLYGLWYIACAALCKATGRPIFALSSVGFHAYCSVLNNRPLLIIIRGEFQAIETQYSAEQYPCSISKLIKSGIKDTKPKFEQSRTKTVDFRRN